MSKQEKIPDLKVVHPVEASKWLRELEDWAHPYEFRYPFAADATHLECQRTVMRIPEDHYRRLLRESEGFYAMAKGFRQLLDRMMLEWGRK